MIFPHVSGATRGAGGTFEAGTGESCAVLSKCALRNDRMVACEDEIARQVSVFD